MVVASLLENVTRELDRNALQLIEGSPTCVCTCVEAC